MGRKNIVIRTQGKIAFKTGYNLTLALCPVVVLSVHRLTAEKASGKLSLLILALWNGNHRVDHRGYIQEDTRHLSSAPYFRVQPLDHDI
jgi:hypothetical protein